MGMNDLNDRDMESQIIEVIVRGTGRAGRGVFLALLKERMQDEFKLINDESQEMNFMHFIRRNDNDVKEE